MRRCASIPRDDWQARCEAVGFTYYDTPVPAPAGAGDAAVEHYWNESAAYAFDLPRIEHLEQVTEELHALALDVVDDIVRRGNYAPFALTTAAVEAVEKAWRAGEESLYGRFDFSWDGHGEPKLLEYNADTPTSLLEASVVQWFWLQDVHPGGDQFNSLHEKLVARWRTLARGWPLTAKLHLAAMRDSIEDACNVGYMLETAHQADIDCVPLAVEDIGYDTRRACFVDLDGERITHCFKLYPWEWLFEDAFAVHLPTAGTRFVEPAWKQLLSSKAILPLLWARAPKHPNLLAADFAPTIARPFVRKPIYSREGANVELHPVDGRVLTSNGPYDIARCIWQEAAVLPCFDGRYPLVTSWVVGDAAAGVGIRESAHPITRDTSSFVPHYIV